jgi:hypothetical protein
MYDGGRLARLFHGRCFAVYLNQFLKANKKENTMKYIELKKLTEDRLNSFEGLFFAFSDKQLKEAMANHGLDADKKEDIKKIVSIGHGGYLLRSVREDFHAIMKQNEVDLERFLSDESNLIEALVYELGNHEYCITYDSEPAIEALGLEVGQVPRHVLRAAKVQYLDEMEAFEKSQEEA